MCKATILGPLAMRFRVGVRYNLKLLLLMTTAIAIFLGMTARKAERQRQAVEIVQRLGGQARFDFEFNDQMQWQHKAVLPGPSWLHRWLGPEYSRTLIVLSLSDTNVGDKDLERLSELAPDVKQIWLQRTEVTDVGLRYLVRFRQLEKVALDESNITDQGIECVARCPNIWNVQLTRTSITDEALKFLAKLEHLEQVGLSGTNVTDAGLADLLHKGTKLYWINLSKTAVSDASIDRLMQLTSLEFLNVQFTQVTAEGARRVRDAHPNGLVFQSIEDANRHHQYGFIVPRRVRKYE